MCGTFSPPLNTINKSFSFWPLFFDVYIQAVYLFYVVMGLQCALFVTYTYVVTNVYNNKTYKINKWRLSTVDLSARVSMKNAAKCDT